MVGKTIHLTYKYEGTGGSMDPFQRKPRQLQYPPSFQDRQISGQMPKQILSMKVIQLNVKIFLLVSNKKFTFVCDVPPRQTKLMIDALSRCKI